MNTSRELFLINAMNAGMERAARSFSVMINSTVRTNPTQITGVEREDNFLPVGAGNSENLYLLTTHLIGDVNGRSYLIFGEKECQSILTHLKQDNPALPDTLLEAFLMEIDNIVSAAVISELSDRMKIEMYGDVPQLKRMGGEDVYAFIAADKDVRDSASLVVNTGFVIEKCPDVRPQFIWKISPGLLDRIPLQMNTAENR